MKFLYTHSFYKDYMTFPCRICSLSCEEIPMILSFQQQLYEGLYDKDILVTLSESEWRYLLENGFALGVFPESQPEQPAYVIGCLYPPKEENLGVDIGLSQEELTQVAHLEIAMADPDFRGWGMHSQMCAACVEILKQDNRTRFVMATVSPHNLPSLKAVEFAGLSSVLEKEKYGGKLRCIMLKKLF